LVFQAPNVNGHGRGSSLTAQVPDFKCRSVAPHDSRKRAGQCSAHAGTGTADPRNRGWEFLWPLPSPAESTGPVIVSTAIVERRTARTCCVARPKACSPQKPPTFHSFFSALCGSGGKNGSLSGVRGAFSKSPELHSWDLEKQPTAQIALPQSFRKDFHFSSRTTETTVSFFNLITLFLLSVALDQRGCAARLTRSSLPSQSALLADG